MPLDAGLTLAEAAAMEGPRLLLLEDLARLLEESDDRVLLLSGEC
jgi:hypothetical protein